MPTPSFPEDLTNARGTPEDIKDVWDDLVYLRDLLTASLDYLNIATGGIRTANYQDLSVTAAKLADLTVTGAKVANATLTADKFAAGVLGGSSSVIQDVKQEGVYDAGELRGTPAGVLQVAIAAGKALIEHDIATYGTIGTLAHVRNAAETLTCATADASNPRIDVVVLTLNSGNTATLSIVAGSPTVGATLDNRNGAGAVPSNALHLMDILVPAGHNSTFTAATHFKDRRRWARGASWLKQSANSLSGGAATSYTAVHATDLKQTVELSGKPLRVRLWSPNVVATGGHLSIGLGFSAFGAAYAQSGEHVYVTSGETTEEAQEWIVIPPGAGRYEVDLMYKVSAGSGSIQTPRLSVEEAFIGRAYDA